MFLFMGFSLCSQVTVPLLLPYGDSWTLDLQALLAADPNAVAVVTTDALLSKGEESHISI
jgi:hypothetical protein